MQPTPPIFPTDPSGLPEATRPAMLELADGDVLDLRIGAVAKTLCDTTVRMLGYNGSIPGPTLKVQQGSEVVVHVVNEGDLEATVHWHGLRLENKYDGVPHETQQPIPVGGEFTYRIRFPDPGLYWYHPHPEVTSDEPGRCPKCGMKLLATAVATGYACPMHPEVTSDQPGRCPKCGMKLLVTALATQPAGREPPTAPHSHDSHGHHGEGHSHGDAGGIEWEDDMVAVNRLTTPANMRWKLVDRTSGAANAAIDWRFTAGDRVKIALVNEMDSDHPMHHPFHLHGAGRFLVLARDGVPEPNLVWKDTVLVRTGQTVDILFDVTNPGLWMAHCHIAEHMQSGMMFSFTVARGEEAAR
jgi:FtsP/CotA-like multicopper oxidase with cupredoxin domain